MKLYRLLLWLYPRRFRREYAHDMVALLEEQLRAEHPLRIAGRTAMDLLATIPIRHMEVLMPNSSATPVIITLVTAAATLAVLGGLAGVASALLLVALAALIWRLNRPSIAAAGDARWWKLLLGGVALLATFVVVSTMIGELPGIGWAVGMVTLLVALGLIAWGAVLGIAMRPRAAP